MSKIYLEGGVILTAKNGEVKLFGSYGLYQDDIPFATLRYDDYEIRALQTKIDELQTEVTLLEQESRMDER